MTRPKKERKIHMPPTILGIKPWGTPSKTIEWIGMSLDEYEAIRLVDFLGMSHQQAAEKMEISRPTLTRLLESAHKKIAETIVQGKGLLFQVPEHISISQQRYFCNECNSWQLASNCPDCGNKNLSSWQDIYYTKPHPGRFRRRRGKKWNL